MLCLSGAAVKAYMEYTMSTEKGYSSTKGGQRYAGDFKFTSLPTNLLAINNAGIASITLASDVTPFQWEWSTDTTIGPQRNTLSCKRSNYDTYGLSSQGSALAELLGSSGFDSLEEAHLAVERLRADFGVAPSPAPVDVIGGSVIDDDDDDDDDGKAAMAIAVVALVVALIALCLSCLPMFRKQPCADPSKGHSSI